MVVPGAEPLDAHPGAAAEDQDQLAGVVLGVPQVVQEELADVQLVPPEPAALQRPFVRQLFECLVALPQTVVGVLQELVPGVGLLRRGDDPGEILVVAGQKVRLVLLLGLRLEGLQIVRQVEVCIEQRMVGQVPEWRTLATVVPQLVRAGLDGRP